MRWTPLVILLAGCAAPNVPPIGEPQAMASSKPFPAARDCVTDAMLTNVSHLAQIGSPERVIFIESVHGVTHSRVEVHPDGVKSRIIVHAMGLSVPRVKGYVEHCL
jgi:hypothetical protein